MKGFVYLLEISVALILILVVLGTIYSYESKESWERADLVAVGDNIVKTLKNEGVVEILNSNITKIEDLTPPNVDFGLKVFGVPKNNITVGCRNGLCSPIFKEKYVNIHWANFTIIDFDINTELIPPNLDVIVLQNSDQIDYSLQKSKIINYLNKGGVIIAINDTTGDHDDFNDIFGLDQIAFSSGDLIFNTYNPSNDSTEKYFLGLGFNVERENDVDGKKRGYLRIWDTTREVNFTQTSIDIENLTADEGFMQDIPVNGKFNLKGFNNEWYTFKIKKIFWDNDFIIIQPLNISFIFKDFTDFEASTGVKGIEKTVTIVKKDSSEQAAMTRNGTAFWISEHVWDRQDYVNLIHAALASKVNEWYVKEVKFKDWWNPNWQMRRKLTFDNSVQTGDLDDFPVLVKLTTSNFDYNKAKSDGSDLRFIDSDGNTVLKYHIEKWNNGGESFVWVKVPNIPANSNTDYIWVYYNNPQASGAEDKENTYDSNFVAVWHFDESSGTIYDSTNNDNDGTNYGSTYGASGMVDATLDFDGDADYVDVPLSESLNITGNQITVEAWIKPYGTNWIDQQWQHIINNFPSYHIDILGEGEGSCDRCFRFGVEPVGELRIKADGSISTQATLGEWYYVVGVVNTTHVLLYINGSLDVSPTFPPGGTLNASRNIYLKMARFKDDDTYYDFNGMLDEVRISNTSRSESWINASYLTMSNQFITIGKEDSWPSAIDGKFAPKYITVSSFFPLCCDMSETAELTFYLWYKI